MKQKPWMYILAGAVAAPIVSASFNVIVYAAGIAAIVAGGLWAYSTMEDKKDD